MSKTRDEVLKELDAKIPRDAISQRQAGGGKSLSYLETHYVIARANEVFGNDNWDHTVQELQNLNTEKPSYLCRVRVTAQIGNRTVVKEGIGYGSDKSAMNPHELAAKEAESDALKRAMMKFGMSMGLALYDKSQENVEDEPVKAAPPKAQPKAPSSPAVSTKGKLTADTAKRLLREGFATLKAAGKLTKEQFQKDYTSTPLDELSEADMLKVYSKFTQDFPEVAVN